MILPLDTIRTGDECFIRSWFVWNNPNDWLPRIINVMINLWNFLTGKPYCPANHCAIFVWENNVLYLYEAQEHGYVKNPAIERFAPMRKADVWIKRYDLDSEEINRLVIIVNGMLGDPYNIGGLVKQGLRELTDRQLDPDKDIELIRSIEKSKEHHKIFFCSEANAYAYFNASHNRLCIGWYIKDPYNLYFDSASKFLQF